MVPSESSEQRQLYCIFRDLADLVSDENDRGLFVGYVILDTILIYQSPGSSREEIERDQTATVCSSLERTLGKIRDQDYNSVLQDITLRVDGHESDDLIEDLRSLSRFGVGQLLADYFQTRRKSPDVLRRLGISLLSSIEQRGKERREIDALRNDYRSIAKVCRGEY